MAKRRGFDAAAIKLRALRAIFSDADLTELLVFKGGNLLDVVFEISSRASADLDFSIEGDSPQPEWLRAKIQTALEKAFSEIDVVAFDVSLVEVPKVLSPDLADFWGGYQVDFKIIEREMFDEVHGDLSEIRRRAISIGKRGSTKFDIDISKHEYCAGKQSFELDDLKIYAYSPEMVVCEKLRAICQQMPEYTAMVKKHSAARARDFVDIFDLCIKSGVRFESAAMARDLPRVFAAKRVPLRLLGTLAEYRDFHRQDFPSVVATVKAEAHLEEFDFYFDFVLERVGALKSLWDE